MIRLQSLRLKNVVFFNDFEFDFSEPGVSYVYGLNKDSSRSPDKSNGAGKSMPFLTMMEMLAQEHPFLEGKHIGMDSFQRSGALGEVVFDGPLGKLRLDQYRKGKSVKLDLFRHDGSEWKPTHTRTNAYVKEKLQQAFPLSSAELFSLFYIDHNRPSDIQRGRHAERLRLLSQMLQLDKYDQVLAAVKEKTKSLRDLEARLLEVQSQIDLYENDLEELAEGDEKDLSKCSDQLADTREKLQEASEMLRLRVLHDAYHSDYEKLLDFLRELPSKQKVPSVLTEDFLSEVADAMNSGRKKLEERAEKAERFGDYRARRKELEKKLAKLGPAPKGDLKKLRKALAEMEDLEDAAVEAENELKLLKVPPAASSATDLEKVKHALEKSKNVLQVAQARSRDAADAVVAFKESITDDDCTCTSCYRPITSKEAARILSSLEANVSTLRHDESRAFAEAVTHEKQLAHLTAVARKQELQAALAKRPDSEEIEELQGRIKKLESLRFEQDQREAIESELAELEGYEETKTVAELTERVALLKELRAVAKKLEGVIDDLEESRRKGIGKVDRDDLENKVHVLSKRAHKLSDQVAELSRSVGMRTTLQEKLEGLAAKRDRLTEKLELKPVLKALEDTYGQAGLKNLRLRNLCSQLEFNLNREAKLLISEPCSFSIQVDESHVHILMTRKKNGSETTTDVRRLSAAEACSFNLIWPLAMFPLQPDDRKLNTVWLDEPTANMDGPAREMFVTKYLPRLRQFVDNVVVISPVPLSIEHGDGKVYRVTRENHVSRIEQIT